MFFVLYSSLGSHHQSHALGQRNSRLVILVVVAVTEADILVVLTMSWALCEYFSCIN